MKLSKNGILFSLLLVCFNIVMIALYLIFFVDSTPLVKPNLDPYKLDVYDIDFRLNDEKGAYLSLAASLYQEGYFQAEEYHGIGLTSNASNFKFSNTFVDKLDENHRWSGFYFNIYSQDLEENKKFKPSIGLDNADFKINIPYDGEKKIHHHDGYTYELFSENGILTMFYYPDEDWYSKLDLAPDFPCQTTYSVELARPNQQFELVGCFDTLEDAKKELNRNAETKVLTPVIRRYDNKIIDMSSGYVNLGVVPITEIIGMYESETDRSYSTYTNGQFGYESLFVKSEVSEYGRVKIKLSGKMAWVKFETGDYHLELVPTSQILDSFEDISHYTVFVIDGNRELNHKFTHRNIFLNDISAIKLGFAPSFMEEDEKYYSFDGHYFYDDYLKMFKDAVLETNGNAINEEPYYNYYQYVTVRSESNYNGDDLDRYYEYRGLNRDSIMDGNGNYFIHAEQTTGINGAMEYAWAAHESAFGSSRIALDKNNLFGMGAYDGNPYEGSLAFDSVLEGVEYHAKRYLSIGYTDALSDSRYYGAFLGNKASGMNVLYASDPYWGEKIAAHYFRLDLLGGLQDYAKYDLVIKESNQVLKTLYSENGDIAYYTKNNHKDFQLSYQAFTLLGETEDYYLIASDMPIRISEKEVCLYTVFNTSTGLYDTIDTTSDVSIGKIGFACTYNFDNNILYLEKSIHLREVKEK